MARFKAHFMWRIREPGGVIRYYRDVKREHEMHRVVIPRSDERYGKLTAKLGRNKDMAEIQKWLKNPDLIGEYFWRINLNTDDLGTRDYNSLMFFFTQIDTAVAMKIAWA